MEKLPTFAEVADDCERLARLLRDPHPGLITWQLARWDLSGNLREKLNAVLTAVGKYNAAILEGGIKHAWSKMGSEAVKEILGHQINQR